MKTAGELIEILKALPKNTPVAIGVPNDPDGRDLTWVPMVDVSTQRWPGFESPSFCIVAQSQVSRLPQDVVSASTT